MDILVYLFSRLAWLEVGFGIVSLLAGFGVGYHYWYQLRRRRFVESGEKVKVLERQCGRLERRREVLDHQLREARAGTVDCLRGTLGSGEERFAEFSRRIGGLHHELTTGFDALIRARRQASSSSDQIGGGKLQIDGATESIAQVTSSEKEYNAVVEGLGEALLPLRGSSHELAEFSSNLGKKMERLGGKGDRLKALRDRCGELLSEADRCHREVIAADRFMGTGFGSGGNAMDPKQLLDKLGQIEEGVLAVHRSAGILMDETDQLSSELSPFLITKAEQQEVADKNDGNPLEECSEQLIDTAGVVYGWVNDGTEVEVVGGSKDWSGQIAGAAERVHAAGSGLCVAEAELQDIQCRLGGKVRELHAYQSEFAEEMGAWLDTFYGRFEGKRKTIDREWRVRPLASADEESGGLVSMENRLRPFHVVRTLGAGGGVRLAQLSGDLAVVTRQLKAGGESDVTVHAQNGNGAGVEGEVVLLRAELSKVEAELKLKNSTVRDLQLQLTSLEAKLPDEDLEIDALRAEIDSLKEETRHVLEEIEGKSDAVEEPMSSSELSNGSDENDIADVFESQFASFGFGEGLSSEGKDDDDDEEFILGRMEETQALDLKAEVSDGKNDGLPDGAFCDPRLGILYRSSPDKVDSLTEIKGVGEAIEQRLNAFGVYRFDQIAAWKEDVILEFSERLSFKGRVERDDWVGQAKKLIG